MPFRTAAAPLQVLSDPVKAALTQLGSAGTPVRVLACDPERELHVVAHASLATLVVPVVFAVLFLTGAVLTTAGGDARGALVFYLVGLPFAKWAHFRWLAARRQGFHLVRGVGLTRWVPGLGVTSRREHAAYARLLARRDGRVFATDERLLYKVTRQGTDGAGRPRMVEDRSVVTQVYLMCTALIDGKPEWALEVIAPSEAVSKRTIAALDQIFAAFVPSFVTDEREAKLAAIERTTKAGSIERHVRVGTALLARNAFQEAEHELVLATELEPQHAGAWNLLGRARLNQTPKQVDAAIACFDRSIELAPAQSHTHYNRAFALRAGDRRDEALEALRRAIACAEAAKDDKEASSLRTTLERWSKD